MPVIVKVKYPQCKGETDLYNETCVTCDTKEFFKLADGAKYLPSRYTSSKEKQGNEREREERQGR